MTQRPNERWATDLCRVGACRDGWQTLALVMDCHTREPFLLRSDSGRVFSSRTYTRLFVATGCRKNSSPRTVRSETDNLAFIRTLKEQCVYWHRFEAQQHAVRVTAAWISS